MSEPITNITVAQPRLRSAYEKIRPKAEAMKTEALVPITIDPLLAVSIARGSFPRIMKYHDQILALPGFEADHLEEFETLALAAHYTQTILLAASSPPANFQDLVNEAAELREQLFADATTLARRGLLIEAPLLTLKGPNGFRNIASDVMTISNILRAVWPQLVGKTCVTEAELNRAEVLSDQLINDIGLREQAPATIAAVALERQQTFTLFMIAYDQIRRAISYLRWDEGDTDDIAPSLYSGRKRRAGSSEVTPQLTTTTPATQVSPVTTPAVTPAVTHATTAAVGLPGADPFAS